MTFEYILVNHKCLSVHLAEHFNHTSKTIKVIMKLRVRMYLSPVWVGQTAFYVNVNVFIFNMQVSENITFNIISVISTLSYV